MPETGTALSTATRYAHFGPGIYVHFPFCHSRCGYCDFFTAVGPARSQSRFFHNLLREIAMASAAGRFAGARFRTIFLGGGTPSLLPGRRMRELLDAIRDAFDVDSSAEVTAECNPESLHPARMAAYAEAGVNRISLGVQSFDDAELALLDRPHSAAQARRRFRQLRQFGFRSVSLDLIYGLPERGVGGEIPGLAATPELADVRGLGAARGFHEVRAASATRRLEGWQRTLDAALALEPDHLSAYLLGLEPRVPLARALARERLSLPEGDAAREEYERLRALAAAAGLLQYEISNFARPGHESRHNQNYWVRGDYLGLGPSAHSHRGGLRWSNVASMPRWREGVRSGRLAVEGEERITGAAVAAEWIFLGLRRAEGVPWGVIAEAAGPERKDALEDKVRRLRDGGLLHFDGGRLALQTEAYFVSNAVFTELLGALE